MNLRRRFSVISIVLLIVLAMTACGKPGVVEQNNGKLTICHANGDTTTPYDQLTLDFAGLAAHASHQDDLIPAPAAGCPKTLQPGTNNGKLTICHATGSATNPYNEITIDFNGLQGHGKHTGDLIPAPEGGCPLGTATPGITGSPTITATLTITGTPPLMLTPPATIVGDADGKITICHATGSKKNPYVLITISVNGLNGHSNHSRDIIPAPAGGCPG
jgi:hypothetical protein